MSPCFRPALSAGESLTTSEIKCSLGFREVEGIGDIFIDRLQRDAEEAAGDQSFVDDLSHDVLGHVARDRKTDSHVAAAARDDRCIDPDHFAF